MKSMKETRTPHPVSHEMILMPTAPDHGLTRLVPAAGSLPCSPFMLFMSFMVNYDTQIARTVEILESGTMYREALAGNIIAYYRAVQAEKPQKNQKNKDTQTTMKKIMGILKKENPPEGIPERRACVHDIKKAIGL